MAAKPNIVREGSPSTSKPEPAAKQRKRRTQAERTALSDQRMFDAAISLINERGTQKTTLKEIGELAGYSRGLANYRFGSKEGLWREMARRFYDAYHQAQKALFDEDVGFWPDEAHRERFS